MGRTVIIGFGSNLGDRLFHIQQALDCLGSILTEMRCSTIVESSALLQPGSPAEWNRPYLNGAVVGRTCFSPHKLLRVLQDFEKKIGSVKAGRWAPRKIDLDILAYEDQVVEENDLKIPHPGLLYRSFALFPVSQLAPSWRYPVEGNSAFGKTALELAHGLTLDFHQHMVAKPFLVGVLNIAPDSFSDGGQFQNLEQTVEYACDLLQAGASWIDLGAVSTRPGADNVSPEEEWKRLHPVLSALQNVRGRISVDTIHPIVALRAIDLFDVHAINFEGNSVGTDLAKTIEKRQKQLVVMHSLSIPPSKAHVLPFEKDPVKILQSWADQKVSELEGLGVNRKRLILDPGIGFGKTAWQNQILIQRICELRRNDIPLMVGHSRKSFLQQFCTDPPAQRDISSAVVTCHLMEAGVEYLRVHNVQLHMKALAAQYFCKCLSSSMKPDPYRSSLEAGGSFPA
jgi:2-amino-4-hydroxy-6-hydroxymethyldihydropteridine diphosphokinase/dihydropteroate synthase